MRDIFYSMALNWFGGKNQYQLLVEIPLDGGK